MKKKNFAFPKIQTGFSKGSKQALNNQIKVDIFENPTFKIQIMCIEVVKLLKSIKIKNVKS